jgi:hypothetical protein
MGVYVHWHPSRLQTVAVQAIRGWHQLVKTLADHAPDMLQQVAPQVMGRLLPILAARPPTTLLLSGLPTPQDSQAPSRPSTPSQAPPRRSTPTPDASTTRPEQRQEHLAVAALLHELVVDHSRILGVEVLRGLPPLPEDIMLPQLEPVRKV